MRLLPVLLVAACASKPSGSTTTPDDTGGGATASRAPYATMFEQGHTWSLQVTSRESHWDDQDPAADAHGNVVSEGAPRAGTCSVAEVVEVAGGKASKLQCDWGSAEGAEEVSGNDPLTAGAWYANERGLYMIEALPEAGATVEVGEDELVLAAQPVAFTRSLVDENDEETEGMIQVALEAKDGGWCWTYSAALGDEIWMTLCFGPDDLRGGDFGWVGGSEHSTTFTVVK